MIGAVLVVLVLWGSLTLGFRSWRAHYFERAAFGVRTLAPALGPLVEIVPPGLDPVAWREAVAETRALLDRLARSGVLGLEQLRALRAELDARVRRARDRPEAAPLELLGVWSQLESGAGPVLAGARRPRLLAPALALGPLDQIRPTGVDPEAWRAELDRVRLRLVARAGSGELGPDQIDALAARVADRARAARPETARSTLDAIGSDPAR